MKSFLKKTSIILIIFFLLLGLTLYIGIKLPKEIYKQKAVKTPDFLLINCNIVDVISDKIIPNRQILVQNGVIKAIDSLLINVPPEISNIDSKGKYLMPSLWNMHIHTLSLSPQLHFITNC